MAENNKHKKIVKVVDIIRVPVSKQEKKARTEAENLAQERESKALDDLEELVSYHDEQKQKQKEEAPAKPKKRKRGKKFLIGFSAAVIIFIIGYVAFSVLPKVDIKITTKKVNWQTQGSIIVNKNISQIDFDNSQIPGEIIKQQKTVVMQFTPTGQKNLEKKASGTFTLYNAYSSAPQTLVATTRLQAPNGKIYRLVSQVIVPGAKVASGKITPSSIDVSVVADQAGPDYNSGAIDKLTIPGLKGTPKYNGFYASAPNGISGGFVGEGLYPTADDISKAKDQTQISLDEALKSAFVVQVPEGFTYVPNSVMATTTKITVNTNTDANNQFSVVADGQVTVMTFRESDVLDLLKAKAQKDTSMSGDYEIKTKDLNYGNTVTDLKLGKMTLPINFSATYWIPIDISKLTGEIMGKSESELKSSILSLPGVDTLSVDFYPMWVVSVPKNASKINISVE